MSEDSADTKKRIKQLENQNLKLQRLLDTALDVATQDTSGITALKDESHTLAEAVENLEKQKAELETELTSVLGGNELAVFRLEREQVDLKGKLDAVLSEIKKGDLEIRALKSEDEHLKEALTALETEKNNLLEELKMIEENKTSLSQMSLMVQEKLSEIENRKTSLTETKSPIEDGPSSEETILSNFKNLEKTYKDYLHALEDHDTLERKISELEEKKEVLVGVVDSDSHRARSQMQLCRVIESNTNVMMKIRTVKSTLQNNLSINSSSAKSMEAPKMKMMVLKVSELERQKDDLYDELQQTLEKSSREIESLGEELSDPDMKRLINEIEIQKTVLLYNLKLLKIEDNPDKLDIPSIPSVKSDIPTNCIPTTSELEARAAKLTRSEEIFNTSIGSSPSYEPSTSSGHKNLEDQITRLENERSLLLRRLHSVSETSAQRFEERILQTQSELHCTFMKEKSSEQMITGNNYDDATNQLYGSDDARLEQRIRELEIENERIKSELEVVMEQIREERNMPNQVPVADVLRERIDELEMTPVSKKT